ncbi:hypothetical protein J7E43_05495 [Bacillus sp. ISL-8]|nr:hypothetical protein [Bacillus sp. ISL-8]
MLPKLDDRCEKCNGYGIEWNRTFDRAVDRVMDTQGLSFYDSVNQVRGNSMHEEDYSLCAPCNGTGKKK